MTTINPEAIFSSHPFSLDSEPAKNDPFSVEECIAAVGLHAARAARRGDYACAEDLLEVGKVLEKIAEAQS